MIYTIHVCPDCASIAEGYYRGPASWIGAPIRFSPSVFRCGCDVTTVLSPGVLTKTNNRWDK